ncbi:MAG: toxin-antitoxin system, antitoxin component [Patescibacteria group bacterium]
MATAKTKTRINLSAPKPMLAALRRLAHRDDVPLAAKTLELVKQALELEEDFMLGEIAKTREAKTKKWVSHKEAWRLTK